MSLWLRTRAYRDLRPIQPRLLLVPSRLNTVRHRGLFTESFPLVLVPPVVFGGLLLSLWTYKSIMLVIFQNKIIYMPYIPLGTRREKLVDYAKRCHPVIWKEKRIKSMDGTELALCVSADESPQTHFVQHVIILYFQGNAASLPPRLPYLSDVLQSLHVEAPSKTKFTAVALSYRGYWTSKGSPNQRGIEQDAKAALAWVRDNYAAGSKATKLVIWGQSIGAGVATSAAAHYLRSSSMAPNKDQDLNLCGLVLETPFTSIKSMLIALYPQRWLPYRYLWPFLRNRWDSEAAVREIAELKKNALEKERPSILILQAGKDEVVPAEHGPQLEKLCKDLGLRVERKHVPGALHTEAVTREEGQKVIRDFLLRLYSDHA